MIASTVYVECPCGWTGARRRTSMRNRDCPRCGGVPREAARQPFQSRPRRGD